MITVFARNFRVPPESLASLMPGLPHERDGVELDNMSVLYQAIPLDLHFAAVRYA
jgi:hypothetical protein